MERQLYQITTWQHPSEKPDHCLPFWQLTWQAALVPQWLHCAMPPGLSLMARLLCHLWGWSRGQAFLCWVLRSWSPSPTSKLLVWPFSRPSKDVLETLAGSPPPACSCANFHVSLCTPDYPACDGHHACFVKKRGMEKKMYNGILYQRCWNFNESGKFFYCRKNEWS